MYTTKQQKPQLSRLIQCLLNKKTLNDTSLQLRCGIFAQNKLFPKKDPVYGESGNYKPDDYDDLSEVFGNVQPKKFRYSNGRGYYERKPYFCAEPKALCNLWKRDKKDLDGTKTAKEKWLKNVLSLITHITMILVGIYILVVYAVNG